MVVNTITEAKAQLSALVDRAAGGEEVIISKAAKQLPFWSRILTQAVSAGREGFAGESE